ncbi:hypothetical protein [Leisingera sp. ANG-Vp]|uniref:hypothetical protein n=1 Tax=Leisingera sp. ANG-Vp TaxID=1577896 RepID=UPI000A95D463|nr:hypothetical protein [Leisingera sp. ANG-Vp]
MKGIARWFMLAAVASAVGGMVWGIQMSASQDHLLSPAHGHLNLLGWVSCAIYALYYHLLPEAAEGALPRWHLGCALLALVLLVPGIPLAIQERTEVLAQAGSAVALLSILIFASVVLRSRPKKAVFVPALKLRDRPRTGVQGRSAVTFRSLRRRQTPAA